MSVLSVLATIAVLALLIVVHESGHFLAARLQGIYVNRFSVGFGPVIWKYQGAQTEYALRGFPLGGYVGFPDDDPESTIPSNDPNLLRNRPVLDRAIVISAGVIANLIFAYLVLVLQFGVMGIPDFNYRPGVVVPQIVSPTAPAAQAGIKAGDIILSVDNLTLPASEQARPDLMRAIESHASQPIQLTVQRDTQTLTFQVTPSADASGKGRIGVQLAPNGTPFQRRTANPIEVLGESANRFQSIVGQTVQGYAQLVTNFKQTVSQVSGPVGIVQQGAKFAQADLSNLLVFAVIISINLAVINLLPLPALDGGQLAFLLIEGIRGKPIPTKIQDGVMQTGLVLLLGLGILLIVRDTIQLEWVQKLFQ